MAAFAVLICKTINQLILSSTVLIEKPSVAMINLSVHSGFERLYVASPGAFAGVVVSMNEARSATDF